MNVFKPVRTRFGAHFGGLVQIALVLSRGRGNTVAHIRPLRLKFTVGWGQRPTRWHASWLQYPKYWDDGMLSILPQCADGDGNEKAPSNFVAQGLSWRKRMLSGLRGWLGALDGTLHNRWAYSVFCS